MEATRQQLHLTLNFTRAIDYARQVHVGYRKGTKVPYMAHLLGVASLVMGEYGHVPFGVTENIVVAALLHDAVEDAGGLSRLRDIEANFGSEVAAIVEGCSDTLAEDVSQKEPWEERKKGYIERLPNEPPGTLLVSLADKLYNSRAILEDYRIFGPEVWKRFKRGRNAQLWYFDELLKIYARKCPDWRIVDELKRTVEELRRLSANESTPPQPSTRNRPIGARQSSESLRRKKPAIHKKSGQSHRLPPALDNRG